MRNRYLLPIKYPAKIFLVQQSRIYPSGHYSEAHMKHFLNEHKYCLKTTAELSDWDFKGSDN